MSVPAVEFHLFPHLAPELRRLIWKECLPHRVVEMYVPGLLLSGTHCELVRGSFRNTLPPIITRVCRESRQIACEKGHLLSRHGYPDDFYEWDRPSLSRRWFNPATDILHLDWDLSYVTRRPEERYRLDSCKNSRDDASIPFFLQLAAKSTTVSIAASLVGGFCPGIYSHERLVHFLDLLEPRKNYLVALEIVEIHCSLDRALESGLFSREERLRLVPATDLETVSQYRKLWAAEARPRDEPAKSFFEVVMAPEIFDRCNISLNAKIERTWVYGKWEKVEDKELYDIEEFDDLFIASKSDSPRLLEISALQAHKQPAAARAPNLQHPWVKKIMADMPRFSPVIVFRFCEMDCYAQRDPSILAMG
jgi:hypothetical protein